MSFTEKNASVIVTGASSGIGAEIAQEYSRNGYFVFLLGRSQDKLDAVQKLCIGKTETLAFDLKEIEKNESRIKNLLLGRPHVEVIVNNAGIYTPLSFEKTDDTIWHDQFEVNLMGPVRLTRLLWPMFVQNKKGSIINISSTLGLKPVPNTSAYSAIKAAMINWTLALAQEGGSHGIRANCICPGIVDTPIHSFHALPEKEKQEIANQITKVQLLNRLGTPKDIALATYFLGSDISSWTTGAVLSIDGGVNIK